MSVFGIRGIHVPHRKNTAGVSPMRFRDVKEVLLPTVQHIGAPAKPVVKVGDTVAVGDLVAEAGGFVSSPIYAPVSGKVKKIEDYLLSNGSFAPAILIESDREMRVSEKIAPPNVHDFDSFVAAVQASGLVGLGGAGFPTHVKLAVKDTSKIDAVILNGAECEPYITSDTVTMTEHAVEIAEGIALLETYLGVKKVIIGIEKNKPAAIKKMQEIAASNPIVSVKVLPAGYPQGGEKVLIYNTVGRIVPEGKLPLDVGVIVLNVTSLAFIASYIKTGMPLVEKCITVDGSAVAHPKNVIVPIGTPMKDVFAFCGGFCAEPKKILYGGPMMGIAVPSDEAPILKNTNAILAFDEKDATLPPETNCLHCGKCQSTCPLRLNPPAIADALNRKDAKALYELRVNLCMECGACAFVCPARRQLVQRHKLAKAELRKYQTKLAEEKKKAEEENRG